MSVLYILSMAIAFSFYFGGSQVVFWYKYAIALVWSMGYIMTIVKRGWKIRRKDGEILAVYIFPLIMILGWTLLVWVIKPPMNLNNSNVTRMISNVIYLILAVTSAVATSRFFGKKVIKYSVWAMFISIMTNLVYCIHLYGVGVFFQYLPKAIVSTDFKYGSVLYNFGSCIEVQDATLATGFYLLYFLLFDKEDERKEKIKYVILLLICSYLGFKRTQFIALVITTILFLIIKKVKINLKQVTFVMCVAFLIFSFVYAYVVKTDQFKLVVNTIGADVTGRQNIYVNLSRYYELSLFYIGKGFTFVDKTMYDLTGFAAHNTIIRLYAELGCIPFVIWMLWYLYYIPKYYINKTGKNTALLAISCIMYLFMTYCIGNSMNFYCIQYSFILVPISVLFEKNSGIQEKT